MQKANAAATGGRVTGYTYYLDDRLEGIDYVADATVLSDPTRSFTPQVKFIFDAYYPRLNQLIENADTATPKIRYQYAYYPVGQGQLGAGKVASEDDNIRTYHIGYDYDELGRMTGRTVDGSTETWQYDNIGRLDNTVNPLGLFTYTYVNETQRLQTLTYPNGQISQYTYEGNLGDQRLKQIQHLQADGVNVLSAFDYSVDAGGRLTQAVQFQNGLAQIFSYGHDDADRLGGVI